MAPHQPLADPLAQAEAFANEADQARGDWRVALLSAARMKLDDARAALRDSEEALSTQATSIAAMMRRRIEQRRRDSERIAQRIDELEAEG